MAEHARVRNCSLPFCSDGGDGSLSPHARSLFRCSPTPWHGGLAVSAILQRVFGCSEDGASCRDGLVVADNGQYNLPYTGSADGEIKCVRVFKKCTTLGTARVE